MLEKLLFILLSFILFVITFVKIIKKNDTNYIIILVMQAIGITICFIELRFNILKNVILGIIRYIFSIIIPMFIVIIEANDFNFSEITSVALASFFKFIGNDKLSKQILVKLVTKYPESYMGHKLLAEYYENEGGMRRAIDEYVTSIDIKKNDYKSYFKIAKLLNELDKKDEAIQMLENLLKTKPDYYDASILLGDLLCSEERFKEAINVYSEALKYAPNDFDLYYNLGIVYTRLSDFQMAKEMYERAATINHIMYATNYNLGLIILIQKDYDLAERYFQKSLDGEYEAEAYYSLAIIYTYKGEKDKAINFLNKAIELKPKLLEKANVEPCFNGIKQYITVSVKMNDEEKSLTDENKSSNRSAIMINLEKDAIKYLEDISKLVEGMKESEAKQKIEQKLDYIINRQKIKREKEEMELEELKKEKREREERQSN